MTARYLCKCVASDKVKSWLFFSFEHFINMLLISTEQAETWISATMLRQQQTLPSARFQVNFLKTTTGQEPQENIPSSWLSFFR